MAKPEQTEKATPKRRQEARKKGQVPRSTELAGSVTFLAVVLVLHAFFAPMMGSLQGGFQAYFARLGDMHDDPNIQSIGNLFMQAASGVVGTVLVVFALAFFIGVVTN